MLGEKRSTKKTLKNEEQRCRLLYLSKQWNFDLHSIVSQKTVRD